MKENAQFNRFRSIIDPNFTDIPIIDCKKCPLYCKCNDEKFNYDFEHTCIETLWHYVQTGEFLL